MGKCETANASIGIKILLSDLVSQLNENNFELIQEMLQDGQIEDENDSFNEVYINVIEEMYGEDNHLEFKEHLTKQLKMKGSYHKSRNGDVQHTLDNGCLWDQYLLVPVKELLEFSRWGYDRYGTNITSRPFHFDMNDINLDPYKEIEKTSIVFLLSLHSS